MRRENICSSLHRHTGARAKPKECSAHFLVSFLLQDKCVLSARHSHRCHCHEKKYLQSCFYCLRVRENERSTTTMLLMMVAVGLLFFLEWEGEHLFLVNHRKLFEWMRRDLCRVRKRKENERANERTNEKQWHRPKSFSRLHARELQA